MNIQPLPVQNEINQAKPKKRPRNTEDWKQQKIKTAKLKGQQHVNHVNRQIPQKQRQDPNCPCVVQCRDLFTDPQKNRIFDEFYNLRSETEKTLYLRGIIFGTEGGRNQYHLNIDGILHRVCQAFFLGIHDIKKSRLRRKVLDRTVVATDLRGQHQNHSKIEQASLMAIRNFLNTLEARESHYSRSQNHDKKYLDSTESVASLYRKFLELNPDLHPLQIYDPTPKKRVRFWLFTKIFNYEFNLAFGYPRSDICEICERINAEKRAVTQNEGQLEEICLRQEEHWHESQQFYESMSPEKLKQLPSDEHCICCDFQKNLPLPVTNVTSEYFLSQLWLYNFCVHDLRSGEAKMFVYSEHFAKKSCNEVISCLLYYVENYIPASCTVLNLWCDNSFAQNKNRFLIASLQSLCGNRFREIKISFPIPGHSRMSCDKDFAVIEKKKQKGDKFNFPSDWVNLIKTAQPNKPFTVVYLEHPLTDNLAEDGTPIATVKNYKSVLNPILKPPAGINRIRGIRIDQQGSLYYKTTTYGTHEIQFTLVKNAYTVQDLQDRLRNVPPAYEAFLQIKESKLINVKKLLQFVHIPEEKIFYTTLDLEGNVEIESSEEDE